MPSAEARPLIWPYPNDPSIQGEMLRWKQLIARRLRRPQLTQPTLNIGLPPLDTQRLVEEPPLGQAIDVLSVLNMLNGGDYLLPARQFVEEDGAIFVGNNEDRQYARDYWLWDLHIDPADVNHMVDLAGKVIPTSNTENPYDMKPRDAGEWVIEQVDGFYEHNAKPLNDGLLKEKNAVDGMNDHRKPHIRWVVNESQDILEQASQFRQGIVPDHHLEAAIGAGIHDMGNILNRGKHAKISALLAPLRMPILTSNPQLWEKIQRLAIFHNEPEIRDVIKNVWKTDGNAAETIKRMATDFSPALLAVILADKLHLGQDRLPTILKDPEGLFRDWQIAVNAFFGIRDAGYSQDGKTFSVNIDYLPGPQSPFFLDVHGQDIIKDDSNKYAHGAFPMHQAIHSYLERGIASHSEVLEAMFWSDLGYRERMKLIVMAAFALNPHAQEVTINIHDSKAEQGLLAQDAQKFDDERWKIIDDKQRVREIELRTYRFTRDNIDDQLNKIQQKFVQQGINLEELKGAKEAASAEGLEGYRRTSPQRGLAA